ncbi:MAG: Crp/Fnr family transcriptional regulator [Opitutaceae bacterium]|nr:Crp/Fnr family transcriptional regulator [Cytophagales bacterium]
MLEIKYDKINEYVCRCHAFSEEELNFFDSILEYSSVPKKSFLLQEGEICNFEAYVVKGCARTFYVDPNGFEVTLQFATEDWWVSDIYSFHNQIPSKLFIETLEDCEFLILNPSSKDKLLTKIPYFERVFRLMVQRNLAATQNRLIDTISKSAQEKYEEFLIHYPYISQRVAQHYIASYLGISPEFLSKVRAKMTRF